MIVVGKDRNEPIVSAADEYVERIRRTFPIEVIEVKEEPLKKNSSIREVKRREAERIQKAVKQGEHLVALDLNGKQLSSEDVAARLDRARNGGTPTMTFVIGGPVGLDLELLEARETWSLSKMTLPHRIARLILAEQLYRACTILRGEPYHK
jgi:23S rRNA (pseudouridine1915-N3)-methyltransferase